MAIFAANFHPVDIFELKLLDEQIFLGRVHILVAGADHFEASFVVLEARRRPVPCVHDLLAASVDLDLRRGCIEAPLKGKYHHIFRGLCSVQRQRLIVLLVCIAVLGVRSNSTVPPWTSCSIFASYTFGWRLLLVRRAHQDVVRGSSAHRAVRGRGSDLVLRNLTHRAQRPIRLLSSPLCLWLFDVVGFFRGLSHVVKPALGGSF